MDPRREGSKTNSRPEKTMADSTAQSGSVNDSSPTKQSASAAVPTAHTADEEAARKKVKDFGNWSFANFKKVAKLTDDNTKLTGDNAKLEAERNEIAEKLRTKDLDHMLELEAVKAELTDARKQVEELQLRLKESDQEIQRYQAAESGKAVVAHQPNKRPRLEEDDRAVPRDLEPGDAHGRAYAIPLGPRRKGAPQIPIEKAPAALVAQSPELEQLYKLYNFWLAEFRSQGYRDVDELSRHRPCPQDALQPQDCGLTRTCPKAHGIQHVIFGLIVALLRCGPQALSGVRKPFDVFDMPEFVPWDVYWKWTSIFNGWADAGPYEFRCHKEYRGEGNLPSAENREELETFQRLGRKCRLHSLYQLETWILKFWPKTSPKARQSSLIRESLVACGLDIESMDAKCGLSRRSSKATDSSRNSATRTPTSQDKPSGTPSVASNEDAARHR